MPSSSIILRPGVDTVKTPALNEAGISASNMIRFRDGLVEKRGGWTTYASGVSYTPRQMGTWLDIDNVAQVATAGLNGLTVITGGTRTDITPRKITTTPAISLSTTNGSPVVTITDAGYSPTTNDFVNINNPMSVGGLFIGSGYTKITGIVNATQYQITLSANATSTVTNGGSGGTFSTTNGSAVVTFNLANYLPAVGSTISFGQATTVGGLTISGSYIVTASSPGVASFNARGTATSTATAFLYGGLANFVYEVNPVLGAVLGGSPSTTQDWSLGAFGNILICGQSGGGIYYWSKLSKYQTAVRVTNAPLAAKGMFICDAQQMIVAYGATSGSGGTPGPNVVAWCDTGNQTQWTAAGTNQAGSYTIPTGSGLIGGTNTSGQQNLLWTDIDVWSMSYTGYPLVWGFTKLATGCGLLAQFGWCRLGYTVYWVSNEAFWSFNGQSVQRVDCPLYDTFFGNLNAANSWKIRGAANSLVGEVVWYYPSAQATENDSYVCFNPKENAWDYGTLSRTAWLDQSLAGNPLGADATGTIYSHETTTDANGSAMSCSFQTGWFLVADGENFSFVDFIRPDFNFVSAGTIQVTVLSANYTTDTPTVAGPFSVTNATQYINTRCRGRYMALKFASSDLGSFWRIGRIQVRGSSSGRR